MASSAYGVWLGHRLGKADIEQGEEYIGAVADVIPCPLPLQHGLMQDTGSIEIRIEVVAIVYQTVVSFVVLCRALHRIIKQVLITFAHVEGGARILQMLFNRLGGRYLDTVHPIGELRLHVEHLHRSKVFLQLFSIGIEVIQYAFNLGWCEIDDVICNVLGAAAGFGLWKLIKGKMHAV